MPLSPTPIEPSGATPGGSIESAPEAVPSNDFPPAPEASPADDFEPAAPLSPASPAPASPVQPLPPIENDAAPGDGSASGLSSDRLIGEGFTPFQLSYLAIGGGLREEGIPGGKRLLSAYESGAISAEDIVEAGAVSKRLGTAAADQDDYTKGVDRFLKMLEQDARRS